CSVRGGDRERPHAVVVQGEPRVTCGRAQGGVQTGRQAEDESPRCVAMARFGITPPHIVILTVRPERVAAAETTAPPARARAALERGAGRHADGDVTAGRAGRGPRRSGAGSSTPCRTAST